MQNGRKMSPKPKILSNRHRNAISDKKSNTAEKPPGRIHNNDKKNHQNSKETSGAHLKCGTHRLEVVPTEQGRGGEPKGTNGGLFGGLDRMMCGLHASPGLTTAKTYVTARERVKPN